jgi:hypothetical protein
MIKTAEEYAFKLKPDIDHGLLLWTFQSLDEDSDLEEFFEGLPRLCDSETGRRNWSCGKVHRTEQAEAVECFDWADGSYSVIQPGHQRVRETSPDDYIHQGHRIEIHFPS